MPDNPTPVPHAGRPRPLAAALLAGGLVLAAGARPALAAGSVEDGKALFTSVCAACHTIGEGVRVGPDLQDVAARRSPEWMASFITDPQKMRDAGDATALANAQQFPAKMPSLGLKAEQVDSAVAFLSSIGAGGAPAPAGRPGPYLPTLGIAVLVAAGLTVAGLKAGEKKVEVRS